MSEGGRVLEFIIRVKDNFSNTISKVQNAFKSTEKESANASKNMAKQTDTFAKSQNDATDAMEAATRVGIGLRNVMEGGSQSVGGAIQMVRALAKELKLLATTDVKKLGFASLGPIIGAAAAGFKAGSLLDDAFDISSKVSSWIVKPIQFAVAQSYESFNKLDQIKLDGLKKEIQSIGEELENVIGLSDRALKRKLESLNATTGKKLAEAEAIKDPNERARRIAEIKKESTGEELAQRKAANDEQLAAAKSAQQRITDRVNTMTEERDRLQADEKLAERQFAIAHKKGTLDLDDPAFIRLKESRSKAESFRNTFDPELEELAKQKDSIQQQITDLTNKDAVIGIEGETNTQDYKNAMQAITDDVAAEKEKLADKDLADREKAEKDLAKQRAQDMRALVDEEVALKKGMIDELTEKERSQQDRMARAEQAANQAWAEYKDPELMKTRKEAEAKEKEFQERFAKDKERVGFKVAAGFALTEQEQAAQNVMKAEEEKKEASKALTEIEKNTRDLAKKVDELLKMKG